MAFRKTFRTRLLGLSTTALMATAFAGAAQAQEATPAPAEQDRGDIIVTARKSSENILKTPIAITALTSADIAVRGISTITDVANFTPGMSVNNDSNGRADRSFQQIIIRGMTPSTALLSTTSMFIDGVPVSSATAISTITDPERVEVLKGPQAAYFGRQTFAGAINVVNKLPPETLSGSVSASGGTRSNYDFNGDIGGPILGDILSFRATGRILQKGGSWANSANPGQMLGDQRTKSGTLMLVAKPSSNLTLKAFGLLSTDDDGPSAQGLISAYQVTGSTGNVILPSQSNCTINGNPFFCGTAPALSANQPGNNSVNDSFIKNFLANPTGRLIAPQDGVQGYGLRNRYYHLHLNVDYEIADTGITLSSLTGYNNNRVSELADLDNYDSSTVPNTSPQAGARSYFDYPYLVEFVSRDFSQEVRAAFDNKGPFRLTVGASYLNNYFQQGLGGGNGALGTLTFTSTSGATRNKTMGAFFGLGYDIAPGLTLNVDGRYQIDKLYAYAQPGGVTQPTSVFVPAGFYPAGSILAQRTYKNFMPRVILQYDVLPNTMVYASYSKGINPAAFNTTFLTGSAAVQRAASAAGIGITVDPEKLTNWEIGIKGKAMGNAIRYAISLYRAHWSNQINAIQISGTDPDNNNAPVLLNGSANSGDVILKGIEGEITAYPTPHLTLGVTGAINDSDIRKLVSPTVSTLTGITNFSGKENPNTSKYSASASAQFGTAIAGLEDAAWFVRGDFIYKSGVWADAANIVKTPDSERANFRAGISQGKFALEAFVTNAFNSKAYQSIIDNSVITSTFSHSAVFSALVVGLPDLRTVGVKASMKF